jgi:hypothetical protein
MSHSTMFRWFVFGLVTIALLGAVVPSTAQGVDGVTVVQSDASELRLDVQPKYSFLRLAGGDILPRVGGAIVDNSDRPGEPVRMRLAIPVALPGPSGNSIEVVAVEYGEPVAGRLAPVPSMRFDANGISSEIFRADAAAYAKPDMTPVAELRYNGIARDLHSGTINIEPYLYDHSSGTIRFLRSISLRLKYNRTVLSGLRAEPSALTRGLFVNSSAAGNWAVASAPAAQAFNRRSAVTAARAWFKVSVKNEGLYALTGDDFRKVGLDISTLNPDRIAIYGGNGGDLPEKVSLADSNLMRQMPTIVERNGEGRVSRVLFYANGPLRWTYKLGDTVPVHTLSPYILERSYIVAVDGDATVGFLLQPPVGAATVSLNTAPTSVVNDDDKINPIGLEYISGSGRGWFSTQFTSDGVGSGPDTRPFPTQLPGLERTMPLLYRIRVAHSGRYVEGLNANGVFSFTQGSAPVGTPISIGARTTDETIAMAASRLFVGDANAIPGDNTSMLKITYTCQAPGKGLLDYYEIHYGRRLQLENADHDQIMFYSPSGVGTAEYTIGGFGGNDIIGFDVTDPANPVQLTAVSASGGTYVFRDQLRQAGQGRRYLITRTGSALAVDQTVTATFGDIRNRIQNADILVITHPDFVDAAKKYVEYRNAQGRFSAAYVTTDEIYTEFSHGNLDPTAIRDYIHYTFSHWSKRPSFVLLMGDATYDYRNLVSKQKQYVPAYETEDGDVYNSIGSSGYDDYFVRVVGNDPLLDLTIGRFPVGSLDEAEVMVEKIKRYESRKNSGTWRQTMIYSADDAYPSGGGDDFVRQSEELWNALPNWLEPRKIYLPAYPTQSSATGSKPGAEQDLLDYINRGAVITNWVGHGNPDVWAHETILQKDRSIPKLFNDSMLTYVTAVTCNFGHYDNPNKVSGAEMFLLNPKGGAIAVMTASRAVWISANEYLMDKYMEQLFKRDPNTFRFPTIGQALLAVKQISNSDNDQKYMVFGDPSLYLDLPTDSVVVESVNSTNLTTDTATVAALSQVAVTGYVSDHAGKVRDNFNGTAIVTLYDADRNLTVMDNGSEQRMMFYGGRLFRGPATVTNGRFTATFRVPKDIAYDSATGRLHVYAFNDVDDAAGMTGRVRIYGSDTTHVTDIHGPALNVFLDDRTFRSGDMVSSNPLLIVDLADTSGINSSGSGLGHHIEAWMDNSTTAMDLTDNFQTLPTDYGRGSVERRLLNLEPGEHQIRVRAWDIFNNPTEGIIFFRIAEGEESRLVVDQVVNVPNPMSRETEFTFLHNQSRPLDVEVAIFTPAGRKVRTLEGRGITDRFARVHWDGTDADGHPVANGVYLYRLTVRIAGDDAGQVFETIEKVAVVR